MQDNKALLQKLTDNQADLQAQTTSNQSGTAHVKQQWDKRLKTPKRNLLLWLSSSDSKTHASAPNDEMKEIIESTKTETRQTVSHILCTIHRISVKADLHMALVLRDLALVGFDRDNLGGLSIFYCNPDDSFTGTFSEDLDDDHFRLLSDHQLLTRKDIERATTTSISVPQNIDSLVHTLLNYKAILSTCFAVPDEGHQSPLIVESVNQWVNAIKWDRWSFERAATNQSFLASVLYIIDTRHHMLFNMMLRSSTFNDLEWDDINFTDTIRSILRNELPRVQLPTKIASLIKNSHRPIGDTQPTNPHKKPKRGNNESERGNNNSGYSGGSTRNEPAINTTPNSRWKLKTDESYASIHTNLDSLPTYKDKSLCLKFHVSGRCPQGSACDRAVTHCKLPPAVIRLMDQWRRPNTTPGASTNGSNSTE